MIHPFGLIRRFEERVERGNYRKIGRKAAEHYKNVLTNVDPYERLAQVYSTKARLSDKLALINELVARATGANTALTDAQSLMILAAWATVEERRYGYRKEPDGTDRETEDDVVE